VSRAVAIGARARVEGYGLAGLDVIAAEDDGAARAAWEELPGDVVCVIFTPAAMSALGERLSERPEVIWAVLPA
jgi:hypothetical protein